MNAISNDIPTEGVLLGIDYGTRRIGIAASTWEQNMATPVENYNRRSLELDGQHFATLCTEYRVRGIVIGLPLHFAGHESAKSVEAQNFGQWLATRVPLPIAYWDERCTTSTAMDYLIEAGVPSRKRKQYLDQLAAQLILQSFLDQRARLRKDAAAAAAESETAKALPPTDSPAAD